MEMIKKGKKVKEGIGEKRGERGRKTNVDERLFTLKGKLAWK
jgi:hypothetical protein